MGTESSERSGIESGTANHLPAWADAIHDTDKALALKIMRGQQQLSEQTETAQTAPRTQAHKTDVVPVPIPRPAETQPSPACEQNKAYNEYITFAEDHIWDVPSLGDPDKLLHRFDCDIHNDKEAISKATEALKITGDEYNWVEPPETSKREQDRKEGHYSDIGIRVQSVNFGPEGNGKNAKTTYSSVVDDIVAGSPAAIAGLKEGDQITHVNGVSTKYMSRYDIESELQGNAGDTVTLGLMRDGKAFDKTIEFMAFLERSTVKNPIEVAPGISYIQMYNFGTSTDNDLRLALEKSKNAKALIIDLRNNGGGLLDTSIQAAELLTAKGGIISYNERADSDVHSPKYRDVRYAVDEHGQTITTTYTGQAPEPPVSGYRQPYMGNGRPIIILTNKNTASAAEIFAGALRDSEGAILVGETTFGKGIGQTVLSGMTGGAATKTTSFRYTTPRGDWPGKADGKGPGLSPLAQDLIHNPDHAITRTSQDLQLQGALDRAKLILWGRSHLQAQ
jgi:C-terminal peptidase prc